VYIVLCQSYVISKVHACTFVTCSLNVIDWLNGKTANSSISTTPLPFDELLQETLLNVYKCFILPETLTRVIDPHSCRW